jgi:hypothetical protein
MMREAAAQSKEVGDWVMTVLDQSLLLRHSGRLYIEVAVTENDKLIIHGQ